MIAEKCVLKCYRLIVLKQSPTPFLRYGVCFFKYSYETCSKKSVMSSGKVCLKVDL